MKKIFLMLWIFFLIVWVYIIYSGQTEILSLQNTCRNKSCMSQSIVKIIEKSDLEIYRKDPYHFFDVITEKIPQVSGGWSGFFIDTHHIITNSHVVSDNDAEYIIVLENWEEYPAYISYNDPVSDIAIITINSTVNTKMIISREEVYVSQAVVSLWWSIGKVTAINIDLEIQGTSYSHLMQTDLKINPGDSWSPLFSSDRKIIGMITAVDQSQDWVWYAIIINHEIIDPVIKILENR